MEKISDSVLNSTFLLHHTEKFTHDKIICETLIRYSLSQIVEGKTTFGRRNNFTDISLEHLPLLTVLPSIDKHPSSCPSPLLSSSFFPLPFSKRNLLKLSAAPLSNALDTNQITVLSIIFPAPRNTPSGNNHIGVCTFPRSEAIHSAHTPSIGRGSELSNNIDINTEGFGCNAR